MQVIAVAAECQMYSAVVTDEVEVIEFDWPAQHVILVTDADIDVCWNRSTVESEHRPSRYLANESWSMDLLAGHAQSRRNRVKRMP